MAVLCLLSLLVVLLPAEVTAQLQLLYSTPRQNRLENRITIGCYENTFPVNSAQFWVRREGLVMPNQLQSLVTVQQPQLHQVAFVITQDLEGSYFCSHNNMFSNSVQLVAYPRANITIPIYYVFQPGQSATIDCRVMPGRLNQYYRVSWWNGISQIANSNQGSLMQGYQLHDNFSLTIDSIRTSDSSTDYQCMVTVDDPQIPGTTIDYQAPLGRITVVVYVAPQIMIPPMQRVITVAANELQNTTFVCQASGSPTPQISWLHNGQNISRSTDERFQADITGPGRSRLNITQLRGRDSGTIECVARSSMDIPNRQLLSANASSDTTLSVLTGDFDLMVTITLDGDVQLMVTPIEDYLIPELTRLRISFTSENEESNGVIRNVTSIAAFMNAERIFYQIPSSEVPFQRFRVQVAQLVEGITGPLVPSDPDSAPINDQRAPTMPEPCRDPTTLIVGASLGAIVAVLIVITVVIVVVTCSCYHIHKRRECRKDNKVEMTDFHVKAQIQQEDKKENNREMHRQWSREQATKMLDCFKDLLYNTDDTELKCELIKQSTQLTTELLRLSSVQTDSKEEWNEEIEKERNERVLILLQDILKRGKRNRRLKPDMLKTIVEEVGSEIKEFE